MFKIILISALLIFANTYSFDTIFAEVPESPFGMAVNSLLQMQSQDANGRLQEISDLLQELQVSIDQQQKDADKRIEKVRGECEADIADSEKKLAALKKKLADDQGEQGDLEEEQTNKTKQKNAAQTSLESSQKDFDQASEDLGAENTGFAEYKVGFEEAITACEEAIRLLTKLSSGASSFIQTNNRSTGVLFVQLSQKFSEVQNVLEQHVKKGGQAAFVQPILDVLTDLSSQSHLDSGKIEQIIELISTLLKRLREGLSERTQQNSKTQEDLNTIIKTLQSSINAQKTQVGILDARLTSIAARLEQLAAFITETSDLQVVEEKTLEQEKQDCADEEALYSKNTAQRTTNQSLLEKLIKHFDTQVAPAVKNVRDGQV